jgi:ABC-type lipoprotein release transport system permease subunit
LKSYLSLLKVVLHGRSAGKILLATIFSFTFSITVILCTFGLMDGFDYLLKSGLRHSSGDLLVTNRKGFFLFDEALKQSLLSVYPRSISPVVQTEAFVLAGETTKGVLVRGVEEDNFSAATGLKLPPLGDDVVLGKELARQLRVKTGETVFLTFAKGNEAVESLPLIRPFIVSGVVDHGIYQKDLRFIYLSRSVLSEVLELKQKVNLVILATEKSPQSPDSLEVVSEKQKKLSSQLGSEFLVKPFWDEYDFLIEAVKVEKVSISLILQLIVVVAIFNIVAFVIYIMEKKAQDFFFLRAVGLSLKAVTKFWFLSVMLIWVTSCAGAWLLSKVFNYGLGHLPLFQIPGEIYVLSSLSIRLDLMAYVTVYGISLLWILLAAFIGFIRLKRRPIMQGLRQEFS